jgi:hypothetical protein
MNAAIKKQVELYVEERAKGYSEDHANRQDYKLGITQGLLDNCLAVMTPEQIKQAIGYIPGLKID